MKKVLWVGIFLNAITAISAVHAMENDDQQKSLDRKKIVRDVQNNVEALQSEMEGFDQKMIRQPNSLFELYTDKLLDIFVTIQDVLKRPATVAELVDYTSKVLVGMKQMESRGCETFDFPDKSSIPHRLWFKNEDEDFYDRLAEEWRNILSPSIFEQQTEDYDLNRSLGSSFLLDLEKVFQSPENASTTTYDSRTQEEITDNVLHLLKRGSPPEDRYDVAQKLHKSLLKLSIHQALDTFLFPKEKPLRDHFFGEYPIPVAFAGADNNENNFVIMPGTLQPLQPSSNTNNSPARKETAPLNAPVIQAKKPIMQQTDNPSDGLRKTLVDEAKKLLDLLAMVVTQSKYK